MEPLVSAIIVNWNAKDYLKQSIDSLYQQTYSNFEIILVDNASTDGSIELVENNYPDIKIIKNKKNLGFAQGNNIGIANSNGDLIALFNPDAVADKDWLSNLVSVIQNSKSIGGVAGKMYYLGDQYGKNAVFCTWPKINPYSANPYNFHNDEPHSKIDYLTGAAMLIKKEVIEKIGKLDIEYFLYWEETDLCARMIRAGYDLVYVPKSIVWHAVSPLLESRKKIFYMERNRIRFALKNFDLEYLPIFTIIFMSESLAIFLRDIKRRDFLRTRIRLKALGWNIRNLLKTIQLRKEDLTRIQQNGILKSYNKSLPLKKIRTKN